MSVELDVSQAPLGQLAAMRLVEAVAAGDDRLERHYLEVKSDLDLSRKNDVAKIAKFILGSANRLPNLASTAFEGYAVMVVGVAPGEARGVTPIEVLELDKIIGQYLGVSGPHWDLVRVPVKDSNKEVLVFVVDPPKEGQDPFPCRKEGENLYNGRVYVRADGETREARAEELDLLIERGKYQRAPDVSFEVAIVGMAYPVGVDDARTVGAYVEQTKRQLLAALPRPQADSAETSSAASALLGPSERINTIAAMMQEVTNRRAFAGNMFGSEPESRTEQQYRRSIVRWESQVLDKWHGALDRLAGYGLNGIAIRVSNATKVFFHDVEVKVHLEGIVRGVDWRDGSERSPGLDFDLPSPPREWGPTTRMPFDPAIMNAARYIVPSNLPPSYHSPLDWNNSGSVDLTLDVGDLRPRQTFESDDDELVLVLPLTADNEVRGTWEITARDHNDIYTGELSVPIGPPLELTKTMRKALKLD